MKIRFPNDVWRNTESLSPEARRMHVTGWAICDSNGKISQDSLTAAIGAWDEAVFKSANRLTLKEVFEDLERFGFVTAVKHHNWGVSFKKATTWLAHANALAFRKDEFDNLDRCSAALPAPIFADAILLAIMQKPVER